MIFDYLNKLVEHKHHKQSKDKQLVKTRITMLSKGEERVTQAELGTQSIESGRKQGVFVRSVAGTCRTLSCLFLSYKKQIQLRVLCTFCEHGRLGCELEKRTYDTEELRNNMLDTKLELVQQ